MAGGTISLGSQGYLVAQIVWSATANGTAKNNSTVTASLQIRRSNNYTTTGTWGGSLQVGSKSESISYYGGVSSSWVTIKTITATVGHNSNGTGTCYIYGRVTGPSGTTMAGYALSSSKTVTLDTIPRAATVTSAPNFTDEGNPVLKYSNPAGSSVDKLQAYIEHVSGSSTVEIISPRNISKSGTSYTFNFTDAEREALQTAAKNAKTITARFVVHTVIDDADYWSYVDKTLTIASAAPTLSPTVKDTNATTKALTGDEAKFIKGHSNAAFTVGASALKKATIKSQGVTCGDKSSSSASGTLSAVESGTFTFSVTDSRGYTTTKKLTKTLIDYVALTCSMKVGTPTADGKCAMSISGSCFNGSFGAVANTLQVQYRQSTDGGSTWGAWVDAAATKSGNSYSAEVAITGLNYQQAYTFQARAVDKLATVETATKTVKATPVFDWGEDEFNFNVYAYMANNKAFRSYSAAGEPRNLAYINASDAYRYGQGSWQNSEGVAYYEGNEVNIRSKGAVSITSPTAGLSAREYGVNKVLCECSAYMDESQTINLSEAVSAQPNGVVLVWSEYYDGAPQNSGWSFFFVPKYHIIAAAEAGRGVNCSAFHYAATNIMAKYVYVHETKVIGHRHNTRNQSTSPAISNTNFVLRYVLGV